MTLTQLRYVIEIANSSSMNEAAKNLNISRGSISNVCRGRGKTSGGFVWSYQDKGHQL